MQHWIAQNERLVHLETTMAWIALALLICVVPIIAARAYSRYLDVLTGPWIMRDDP